MFVVGEHAYKVKKLVALGFSTTARSSSATARVSRSCASTVSSGPADTLAGLIERKALTPGHLQAVASRLFAFHRVALPAPSGSPAEVLDVWLANLSELRAADARTPDPAVGQLKRFSEMFVRVHAHEIELRRNAALVRDGHGDLRSEHVLALPSVLIVDRIEFDPSLRCGDVARDLAFLAMDLETRGHRWAAETLVSAYRAGGMGWAAARC
jgi:aminoglycoside phosphotransferase family enzyme